ncbi:MAG: ribokinase, partial [Rhodovulum sp.]
MKKAGVLVVGSYATGLVMQTERLPLKGETLIGQGFRAGHGGKGSNQAVQAARLGADVAFLCCVGRDSYGDAMEALMRGEGVRPDGLLRHETLPTGVGFIVVDARGHNLIAVDLGANNALTPELLEAHRTLFEEADVVLAQMEIPLETALAAMRIGRECGALTVLNPAPAARLDGHDLSCIDFITPNETEAVVCAGIERNDHGAAINRLLQLGCRNVVLTTGADGCVWTDSAGTARAVPGFRVEVVDTVGAGDAFSAAFAVALGEGMDMPDALRFANAAGALSVTRPDTVPSYHARGEVDGFLTGGPPLARGLPM